MKNTSTKTTIKNCYLKEQIQSNVRRTTGAKLSDLYQIESPAWLLLCPIEPAFAMALNEDTTLYNKAFEKHYQPCYPASHIKNN
jgi:DNA recombination protein RmuC